MKGFTVLCLLFVVPIYVKAQENESECQSTLTSIRNALSMNTKPLDTCSSCQGRPGKRGVEGPPGPAGPIGPRGSRGLCQCDLRIVEDLQQKVQSLEEFLRRLSKKPGFCYAGVENGQIPLSDIKASSVHAGCPFGGGILNKHGAWCAAANNRYQWLQIDLRSPRKITGVVTQGRSNHDQWVTSFKVSYGNAENSLSDYMERGSVKVFQGNTDRSTIVRNDFSPPITARYIRIHPVTYHSHMSMRIELLEC